MNNIHPDVFGDDKRDGGQKKRVLELIDEYCKDWYQEDVKIIRERVFMFQNEIENMC
jgi:hypothetical protein